MYLVLSYVSLRWWASQSTEFEGDVAAMTQAGLGRIPTIKGLDE